MTPTITIRSAGACDAEELSALSMRSKAHWGYDAAFMKMCRQELAMTPARMASEEIVVAATGQGRIVGFASYARGPGRTAEVMNCFVEPAAIGTGVGAMVMTALLERARAAGIATLMVDSDPQAEGFYRHAGFVRIGEAPSGSIPGRFLPRLRLDLFNI